MLLQINKSLSIRQLQSSTEEERYCYDKKITAFLLVILLAFAVTAVQAEALPVPELQRSEATLAMMEYLEADPDLMALMEKSIASAAQVTPDLNTNPVRSVEELYDFLDWATICMPWNVLTDVSYPTLYESIVQSIDYIWFLLDQPLEELENKGYYYPVLEYHEPIATWLRDYSVEWGAFLSTEESWNDIYYQCVKSDPSMNVQHGWYADTNVWHTFNEWFSRYLTDPSVRPVADSTVVSPADAKPQGIRDIDENGGFCSSRRRCDQVGPVYVRFAADRSRFAVCRRF